MVKMRDVILVIWFFTQFAHVSGTIFVLKSCFCFEIQGLEFIFRG
jgi:hypothetical protein